MGSTSGEFKSLTYSDLSKDGDTGRHLSDFDLHPNLLSGSFVILATFSDFSGLEFLLLKEKENQFLPSATGIKI